MKKLIVILLSGLMVLSLTGCGGRPSENKIKAALEEGTITIEDAKAKGWIDDEWINKNFEQIKASTKIYMFDPFETTYLDGTPASSKIIEGKMCLVFFDTTQETTMDKLTPFNEACEDMKKKGVPVLGIITDENWEAAKEKLQDIKFPIILYNDGMQKSLEKYNDLIHTDATSVFTKDGGFYSAWRTDESSTGLIEFAEALTNEK